MKSGLLVLLLLADALWPCSVEIYSIEVMVARSPNIVVGVVESVEGEIVRGEEGDNQIRALTSARFRIEEPLKGDLAAEAIDLTFDPELGRTSCDYMYQPFQPGKRLLLMLGPTQKEGPYRPPLVEPAILGMPGDYQMQPLYRYLTQVLALGRSPIQVHFRGPERFALHALLALQMELENGLDLPLEVQVMGDFPGRDRLQNGPVLRLDLAGVLAPRTLPTPVVILPHGRANVDLGPYFETAELGTHQVKGILFLPVAADGSGYWDWWNTPEWRGLYRFTVEEATSVEGEGWGAVKQGGF
ncbi:MAG: hypothetical protein IT369_16540 [Candidatus Latescibacteria bacterium]|nr:hypothetical protein [Candidatus Latescibacterota bacterium]